MNSIESFAFAQPHPSSLLRRMKCSRNFFSEESDDDESDSLGLTRSGPLSESLSSSDCSSSLSDSLVSSDSMSLNDSLVSSGSFSLSDSLVSSSGSLGDSLVSFSTGDAMDEEAPSEQSTSSPSKVSFSETVKVREIYHDEDSDKEEQIDTTTDLKEGDFSRPTIVPVTYSPEEQAIRSKLTGCLPAEVRVCPDFAKMYGCGKTIRSMEDDDSMDIDDDDDDDFLNSEPVRVIEAHAPSSFWFTTPM